MRPRVKYKGKPLKKNKRVDRFGNVYVLPIKPTFDYHRDTKHKEFWDLKKSLKTSKYGKYFCAHCGSKDKLTIDHILPRSKGGDDRRYNLQILCQPCNLKKAAH